MVFPGRHKKEKETAAHQELSWAGHPKFMFFLLLLFG